MEQQTLRPPVNKALRQVTYFEIKQDVNNIINRELLIDYSQGLRKKFHLQLPYIYFASSFVVTTSSSSLYGNDHK